MNKSDALGLAARVAPGFLNIRRSTWIGLGIGLLALLGLLMWAAFSLIGWGWGQAQNMAGSLPAAAKGVIQQAEAMVPGVREKLGVLVPVLKSEPPSVAPPQRDVSGTDFAPVARYPGLIRTHWQRDGAQAAVSYEGKADYFAVLDHYTKGFAVQGFAQAVQSASPEAEAHEYTKGSDRMRLNIVHQAGGVVGVRIERAPT
jgi:hypothetical protein